MQAMEKNQGHALGEKLLVAAFFGALGSCAGLTVIGAGLHFDWKSLILGVVNCIFVMVLAEWLYSGRPNTLKVLQGWMAFQGLLGFVLLGLVVIFPHRLADFHLPEVLGTGLVILQCGAQLAFGLMVTGPRSVREFLASRRGEVVPVEQFHEPHEEKYITAGPGEISLDEGARQALNHLSGFVGLAGNLLALVAALDLLGGLVLLFFFGANGWVVVAGIFALLLTLILWTTAQDLQYLTTTKGYEVPHLTNTRNSFRAFFNFQLASLIVILIVLFLFVW